MESFWDQFVFRVCVGLGEGQFPEGFRSAASLIERAHHLGRLPMERLNDLSVLLIVLACPSDSEMHQLAFDEATRRRLNSRQAWAVLLEVFPPRLTDLLLIGHSDEGGHQKALASGVIHVLYLPSLVRFFTRLTLCPEGVAKMMMTPFVHQALRSLDRLQINADEFLCHLYRQVLAHDWDIADDWPPEPLLWRSNLDPAEEEFLDRCRTRLGAEDRCFLYLSFYARLNVEQIYCIFRDTRSLGVHDVVDILSGAWEDLLADLE